MTAYGTRTQKQFNVLLSREELRQLRHCATHLGVSMATYLRRALVSRLQMDLHGRPTCASGQPCHVPHVHPHPLIPLPDGASATKDPDALPPLRSFEHSTEASSELPVMTGQHQEASP